MPTPTEATKRHRAALAGKAIVGPHERRMREASYRHREWIVIVPQTWRTVAPGSEHNRAHRRSFWKQHRGRLERLAAAEEKRDRQRRALRECPIKPCATGLLRDKRARRRANRKAGAPISATGEF